MQTYTFSAKLVRTHQILTVVCLGGGAVALIGGILLMTLADSGFGFLMLLASFVLIPLGVVAWLRLATLLKLAPAQVTLDEHGITVSGALRPEVNAGAAWDEITSAVRVKTRQGAFVPLAESLCDLIYGSHGAASSPTDFLRLRTDRGGVVIWDGFVGFPLIVDEVYARLKPRGITITRED